MCKNLSSITKLLNFVKNCQRYAEYNNGILDYYTHMAYFPISSPLYYMIVILLSPLFYYFDSFHLPPRVSMEYVK